MKLPTGVSVPLESVLCTDELKRRPSRPPDYRAENQALLALAQELTNSPTSVLQRLVDIALELCRGHSAGISLLEEDGPPGGLSPRGDHFRWHAVAGQWAPLVWNTTTPRDHGPCGTVLDRNSTLLFSNAHRFYTQFAGVQPLLVEGLLVPFHVDGRAVGTVWVIAHDESRKFDAEDQRLLESLATFAAMAYQARLSLFSQAKANQDLAEARAQAEAANRLKDEFLATVSHELRSPLNSIMGWLHVLDSAAPGATDTRHAIDRIRRNVNAQARMISDLLDLSRIVTGKLHLEMRCVDPVALLEEAVQSLRAAAAAKRIELTLTAEPAGVRVAGDPDRLGQVLWNLLSNALKFTPEGGRIDVVMKQAGTQLHIAVTDTGEGIDPAFLPHVFERFRQGDVANRRAHGLGVGLAVVRHIVEMHGGSVQAHSAGRGQGATFTINLPIPALMGSPA